MQLLEKHIVEELENKIRFQEFRNNEFDAWTYVKF